MRCFLVAAALILVTVAHGGRMDASISANGDVIEDTTAQIQALEKEIEALAKENEVLRSRLAQEHKAVAQHEHREDFVQPQYGAGFDFGSWAPPVGQCDGQPNVWTTASCIYAMGHGNVYSIFPFLAGADGQISLSEWNQRVSNDQPAQRIFMALASQERPDGQPREWGDSDDATTIDSDDWAGFVSGAMQASGGDDGRMDMGEFADYVAATVTAESLFDALNGRSFGGHGGQDETLDFGEWAMGFYKISGGDSSVTLVDLSRGLGLQPADVHKVFKFMEDVGDEACDKGWMANFESNAQDEARIDTCEWNQLMTQMQQSGGMSGLNGISKGRFAATIAKMVVTYYNPNSGHSYTRYGSPQQIPTVAPTVSSAQYTPRVINTWAPGQACWSDRAFTWANLGSFTADRFDYKLQTSVNQRTAAYAVTAPLWWTYVVGERGAGFPALDATWSDCGGLRLPSYSVKGKPYFYDTCKVKQLRPGAPQQIPSSGGGKVDIFFAKTGPV